MTSDIERYERNLREELDGAALYAALAEAEADPVRKDLFLQLSEAEAGHATVWRDRPGWTRRDTLPRCAPVSWRDWLAGSARASCCPLSLLPNSPTATSTRTRRTLPRSRRRSADMPQ